MGLYIHFYKPNYQTIIKEIKNKSVIIVSLSLCLQWCIKSFFGKLFTAGGLGAGVMPSIDPQGSPGGDPGDEVTGSSEDLGLEDLLLLKMYPLITCMKCLSKR